MADAREIALRFIDSWRGGIADLRGSFDCFFTERTVWENVGLNRLVGIAAAQCFVDDYHHSHGLDAIHAEITNIMIDGSQVMTERVDHLLRADGSEIHNSRIMGLFEVRADRIIAQRDYFPFARGA